MEWKCEIWVLWNKSGKMYLLCEYHLLVKKLKNMFVYLYICYYIFISLILYFISLWWSEIQNCSFYVLLIIDLSMTASLSFSVVSHMYLGIGIMEYVVEWKQFFYCLLKVILIVLLFQIESAWVENFAEDYAKGISTEDLDNIMQQLVSKVKSRKLSAPGVPQSFREFMVTVLSTMRPRGVQMVINYILIDETVITKFNY